MSVVPKYKETQLYLELPYFKQVEFPEEIVKEMNELYGKVPPDFCCKCENGPCSCKEEKDCK